MFGFFKSPNNHNKNISSPQKVEEDSGSLENFCPICARASNFIEFRGRKGEQCPHCKSLVRTRCVYLCLMVRGHMLATSKVHHFAPEKSLFKALSHDGRNANYKCYDFDPGVYKFAAPIIAHHDLTDNAKNLSLHPADIILHNHVLEHLPGDFRRTISDLNSRLLPGGIHIFTVPFRKGDFSEDLNPALSPDERKKRFAQADHMRIFGTNDTLAMMQALLKKSNVTFNISRHITSDIAQTFGVRSAFEADLKGELNGSTVFYYENVD